MMCAQMGPKGMASAKCDQTEESQLYRMERLSSATFKGKKNAKNAIGVFRLHSKTDDRLCVSWTSGGGCGTYTWKKCRRTGSDSDSQVFHLSRFTDDDEDSDVLNWAGADGRALSAAGCKGYAEGNAIRQCSDDMSQGKRWQLLITDVALVTFQAHLGAKNGAPDTTYEFQIAALTSKSGKYSALMRKRCKSYGMRPVW